MYVPSTKPSFLRRASMLYKKCFSLQKAIRSQKRTIQTVQTSPSEVSRNIGPLSKYCSMLENGVLEPDRYQFNVVKHLQHLYNKILHHKNAQYPMKAPDGREYEQENKQPCCDSFYIYGDVGTGKTALLDLMYECLPASCKKRVHFHTFMISIYSELNRWNEYVNNETPHVYSSSPFEYIAGRLMEDAWIICFDELQYADYASSTLLQGVLKQMLSNGALLIATSNRCIEDLGDISLTENHDGEHPTNSDSSENMRSLKCLLKMYCTPLKLESTHDYRSSMKSGNITYAYPVSNETEDWLDQVFSKVVGIGNSLETRYIMVYGRKVPIPISTSDGIARFTATELFQNPLGPADYIQLCNNYHTVFIDRIPKMGMAQRNEARRFLSFIDAAYESRTKLYCTAESRPEDIFILLPQETTASDKHGNQMHFEMLGEIAYDLALSQIDYTALGIVSGEDEIFSFRRAISRMKEMQSSSYQMRPHQKQLFRPYAGTKEEWKKIIERRRRRISKSQELYHGSQSSKKNGSVYSHIEGKSDDGIETNAKGYPTKELMRERFPFISLQKFAKKYIFSIWGFDFWKKAVDKVATSDYYKTDNN